MGRFIIVLLILVISTSSTADETYGCQELALDKNSGFEQQLVDTDKSLVKLNAVSSRGLAELYETKRKKMPSESFEAVTIYTEMRPESINGDAGSDQEKAKHAEATIERFITESQKNNSGLEVNFRKDQIQCRVKTQFAFTQKTLSNECVARICIKAIPYKKLGNTSAPSSK